jgi:hypothetical protein
MSMGQCIRSGLCFALLAVVMTSAGPAGANTPFEKMALDRQRVLVLTDITNEPDDQESLVRFLVYANEYDVEGLVATTSTWLRNRVSPETIIAQLNAYDEVRDNLLVHADGYPTMQALLDVTTEHLPVFGMAGVGAGKSTDGSRLIIEAADRDDPRPLWISVWGGANCLAQALYDVRETRSPAELEKFVSKLRVYTISDQDDSGRWLRLEFPDLYYIVTPSNTKADEYVKATWTGISGDRRYKNGPFHKFHLVDNPWLGENIMRNHGPLGALYPRVEYIMEGDTPAYIGLINNGLGSALSPSYGGWSGRYHLCQTYAETRPIWTTTERSMDTVAADNGVICTSAQATIWRWREAYQHDFAARMDWCVGDTYEDANHNPVVTMNGDTSKDVLKLAVKSGESVMLNAEGTVDPDGDPVTYSWWVYPEAGTYSGTVALGDTAARQVRFTAPDVDDPAEIHVICEVRDNGYPALFSYRRAIISIER